MALALAICSLALGLPAALQAAEPHRGAVRVCGLRSRLGPDASRRHPRDPRYPGQPAPVWLPGRRSLKASC